MDPKALRQERARLIEDARALVNKPGVTAEEMAQADAMLNRADEMKAQIDRLERTQSLFDELGQEVRIHAARPNTVVVDAGRISEIRAMILNGVGASMADEDKQVWVDHVARDKRILRAYAAGAIGRLSAEDQAHFHANFQNAGGTGTTAGGYTIAPLFEAELLVALKAFGGMRQAARVIQTDTGASLPWPTVDDTANGASIISENTQATADTDLAFGQTALGSFTYRAGPLPVSFQLLQDSAFDFGSLVSGALGTRFARTQNNHFTVGVGTTQPKGVVTAAASGEVGATGSTVSVGFDNLMNLFHSVDPAYRPGSVYMMHDKTLLAIKKLKDTQSRPLFVAGYTVGAPDTLLGVPIEINQDMPVMAANAKSILYGNFNNYIIRDTLGMSMLVLRERFADYGQVAWLAYMRTDGNLISAASPIKYYQNSAT